MHTIVMFRYKYNKTIIVGILRIRKIISLSQRLTLTLTGAIFGNGKILFTDVPINSNYVLKI